MKHGMKWAAICAAILLVIGGSTAAWWYLKIYMAPAQQLVRACDAAVLTQTYLPSTARFLAGRVNADAYELHRMNAAQDAQGPLVSEANEQLAKARELVALKQGEISVYLDARNAMGQTRRAAAVCTFDAAPGVPIAARVASVAVASFVNMDYPMPVSLLRALDDHSTIVQTPPRVKIPDTLEVHPLWRYSSSTDPMTDARDNSALLSSLTTLDLASPYDGAQNPMLALRQSPGGLWSAMVMVERGQFACSSSCIALVRFDNGSVESFDATATSVGETAYLDFDDAAKFVKSMRAARQVKIAASIFGNGAPTMVFDVSAFDASKMGKQSAAGG